MCYGIHKKIALYRFPKMSWNGVSTSPQAQDCSTSGRKGKSSPARSQLLSPCKDMNGTIQNSPKRDDFLDQTLSFMGSQFENYRNNKLEHEARKAPQVNNASHFDAAEDQQPSRKGRKSKEPSETAQSMLGSFLEKERGSATGTHSITSWLSTKPQDDPWNGLRTRHKKQPNDTSCNK